MLVAAAGDQSERAASHVVLHHRYLHGLILPRQLDPSHRRHVIRRLSQAGTRRR